MALADDTKAEAPAPAPAKKGFLNYLGQHPKGFWFIFWGELAERSSYYGMRSILTLFLLHSTLAFTKAQTNIISHGFIAACYLLPLLGGYLADNFLGKYWTLVVFCVPYILGHFILGIETRTALFIALALL